MSDSTLLSVSLQAAVPLWVLRLVQQDPSPEELRRRAEEASQVVASKGDIILYRGGRKGETAAAFNKLAEGVAILSFSPGGVVLFGTRYETRNGTCVITPAS